MVWVYAHGSCNLLVFGNGCFVETLDEGTGMNVPRKSRVCGYLWWTCGYQAFLHICSAVMERLGWVEGTTPFLGTHRFVPRENQIKPECLFPFVDSLLIWLLQSMVFPVDGWCFGQWLWGIEI